MDLRDGKQQDYGKDTVRTFKISLHKIWKSNMLHAQAVEIQQPFKHIV
jgi:hypothetical protein